MAWRPLDVDREKAVTFAIEVMYVTAKRVGKIQRAPLPPLAVCLSGRTLQKRPHSREFSARLGWPGLPLRVSILSDWPRAHLVSGSLTRNQGFILCFAFVVRGAFVVCISYLCTVCERKASGVEIACIRFPALPQILSPLSLDVFSRNLI